MLQVSLRILSAVTPNLISCQAVIKLVAHTCHKTAVRPYSTVAHPGPEGDVGSNMNILTTKCEKQDRASIIMH